MKKILLSSLSVLTLSLNMAYADDFQKVNIPHPEVNQNGKVAVQAVIWHRCPHCKDLEPYTENWLKNSKPDYVNYEIVPVGWEKQVLADGKYYNYAKTLVQSNKINNDQLLEINKSLFALVFNQNKPLTDKNVYPIFSSYGISEDDYNSGLKSFGTSANVKLSEKYTKDYGIEGTPSFVVGGLYAVNFNTIKDATPKGLFEAINAAAAKVKSEMDSNKEAPANDTTLKPTLAPVNLDKESIVK
jgi:thiol:disulfide interchange protein DsbA